MAFGVPVVVLVLALLSPTASQQRKFDLSEFILSLLAGYSVDYYLPSPDHITENEECSIDVARLRNPKNLTAEGPWIAQMVDSWGKVPDGFLFGNAHVVGMFEQCVGVRASYPVPSPRHQLHDHRLAYRNFTGKYCLIAYGGGANSTLPFALGVKEEEEGRPRVGPEARMGIPWALLADPYPYSYSTCIPSSCTEQDLEASLNETLRKAGRQLWFVSCQTAHDAQDLQPGDIAMITILGILIGFALLSTLLDMASLAFPVIPLRRGRWRYLLVFSLHRNIGLVFDPHPPPGQATITCLAGMRVLTMLWIVLCHQFQATVTYASNTADMTTYQDPWLGQIITNGWQATNTFFFIGGLVLARSLLPCILSSGSLNPLVFYLKGVLRLSPSIAVVAAFSATLLRLLATGPRADQLQGWVEETCRPHWWKDPLFVNNYIFRDNDGTTFDDCLINCWFTAVYMQLLLALPLLLLPFIFNRTAGLVCLGVASVVSVVVPRAITIAYSLPPFQLATLLPREILDYQRLVLMAPWCHAAPWLVGVWTALAFQLTEGRKITIPKVAVVVSFVAAVAVCVAVVGAVYPYNHVFPLREYTPLEASAYASLSGPAWALCLAWLVFVCHTGNGGVVHEVLSYRGWWPLSRLSLSIYLVAPVVQFWWTTVQFRPFYFNYLSKVYETTGVFFISLVVGLLLCCLVQVPVASILDLLLSPQKGEGSDLPEAVLEILKESHFKDVETEESFAQETTHTRGHHRVPQTSDEVTSL